MSAVIDHIVVGAASRDDGAAWMEALLGVPPVGFGTHATIGTHNALWGLETAYLEVIAIDPDGVVPKAPRWFGLDDPAVQARLAEGPSLLTWMVETPRIEEIAAQEGLGPVVPLRRDALSWRLAGPADGRLRGGGAVPNMIAWDPGSPSPRETLDPQGWRLEQVALSGTEETRGMLERMGALSLAEWQDGTPGISVRLSGPSGQSVDL